MASYVRYYDKTKEKWVRKEVSSPSERKATVRSAVTKSIQYEVNKANEKARAKAEAEAGETRVTRDPKTRSYTLTTIKDGSTTSRTLTASEFEKEDPAAYRQALSLTTKTSTGGNIGSGTEAVGLGAYGEKITLTRSKIDEKAPQVKFGTDVYRVTSKRTLERKTDAGTVKVETNDEAQQDQLGQIIKDSKSKSTNRAILEPLDPTLGARRNTLTKTEKASLFLGDVSFKLDQFGETARDISVRLSPKMPEDLTEFKVSSAVSTAIPLKIIGKAPSVLQQSVRLIGGFAGAEQVRKTPEQYLEITQGSLTSEEKLLLGAGLEAQSSAARQKGFWAGVTEDNILLTGSKDAFFSGIRNVKPNITEKELKRLEQFRLAKGIGEIGSITFLGATTETAGLSKFARSLTGARIGGYGVNVGGITARTLATQSAKITGGLGIYEGLAIQELQARTRGRSVTTSERVLMGVAAGGTAAAFGGAIGFGVGSKAFKVTKNPFKRVLGESSGYAARGLGYALDPLELTGDALSGVFQRAARGTKAFVPETSFYRQTSRRGADLVTFTQSTGKTKRTKSKNKIDVLKGSNVFTQSNVPINLKSQFKNIANAFSQTQILSVPTSVNVATNVNLATANIPTTIDILTNINAQTQTQTNTQTQIQTNTQTQTQTNVNVNIPTITADLPFIPLGGFGVFGRYRSKGRKRKTGFELQGLSSLQKFVATGTSRKGKRKVFK